MSDLESRMREDRAVRNAARALVQADIEQVKANFSGKSLAKRFADRVSEGAQDIFEDAVETADNNRGALATLVAAVGLWFAHYPIMSLFYDDEEADEGAGDQADDPVNTD